MGAATGEARMATLGYRGRRGTLVGTSLLLRARDFTFLSSYMLSPTVWRSSKNVYFTRFDGRAYDQKIAWGSDMILSITARR